MNNFKLKAKAAIFAGVTLVTSTGFCACGKDENIEDYNNSSLSEVSAYDSSLVDDITTDVTIDENSKSYVTDTDGEISYVDAGVTTDNNTDVVGSKSSSVNGVTTARSIGDNGVVTTKKTTDNDTVKKGSTIKTTITTKKTTPTTTKKTTTTTKVTTTTKATTVTQPPVQNYTIDDICYNADAFEYYAKKLLQELMYPNGGMYNTYNGMDGEEEVRVILAMINNGYISQDVIREVFSKYPSDNIYNTYDYIKCLPYIEDYFGADVDYRNYCCTQRKYIGDYLMYIKGSYKNGSIQSVIKDQIVDNNIEQQYDDVSIMMFYLGYDTASYSQISYDDVLDNYFYVFTDEIQMSAYGYSK